MSEYTPTTEEVRDAYQSTGDGLDFKHRFSERGTEFDRWLEAERKRVWADARALAIFREGADCIGPWPYGGQANE